MNAVSIRSGMGTFESYVRDRLLTSPVPPGARAWLDSGLRQAVPYAPMGRAWLAVLLVGVGLGLFAAILALVGPDAVWRQIQALGPLGFLAMVSNDAVAVAFWIASWAVLLHAFGARLRPTQIAGIGVAGFAVSYITPVAYVGGEPVRAWMASQRSGRPLPTVFATLFVDRLLAGLSLVLFALLGGAVTLKGDLLSPTAKLQVMAGLVVVGLAVALGVLSFARNYHWLSRIVEALGHLRRSWAWPATWGGKIREMEDEVHLAFTQHCLFTAAAFVLQLASFLCTYLRPQIFFYFTEGRRFAISDLAVYFNLNAILTTLLWLTPAGIGTAEGGRVGILGLVGIAPQGAMAFSLTVRFIELLLVGVGLTYLSREGLLQVVGKKLPRPRLGGRVGPWWGTVRGALEVGSLAVYALFRRAWLSRLFTWRYRNPDPWDYTTSPYEKRKYQLKLAILPRRPDPAHPPYRRVLELGCGEGVFTCQLAEAGVGVEVVGVDIAPPALERARARCGSLPNVTFQLLDISQELPEGPFDLVYCSEVLYYLGLGKVRALAERLAETIQPGGQAVLVSAWPAAKLIHRPFLRHSAFRVVGEHVERDAGRPYVITCLERGGRSAGPERRTSRRARSGERSSPGIARS